MALRLATCEKQSGALQAGNDFAIISAGYGWLFEVVNFAQVTRRWYDRGVTREMLEKWVPAK